MLDKIPAGIAPLEWAEARCQGIYSIDLTSRPTTPICSIDLISRPTPGSRQITVLLSQSGLARTWWEDAAMHWLYGKIHIPSSSTKPLTPFELFYGRKPDVSLLRPFGCLAYVHLQKDQRPALAPHAAQCVIIGYPRDYKGWSFWDPVRRKEFISDSAVFRESVFPFRKPGLSGLDYSVDPSPPVVVPTLPDPTAVLEPPVAPVLVDLPVSPPLHVDRTVAPAAPANPVDPPAASRPSEGPARLIVPIRYPILSS